NQKAVETLDFLLQIDPVNAKAMARLALLFAGPLNKPERAVTIANRARSQQPRSPEALDALGWSYIQSGQLAKGERFLKRSLANGETPMAYIHMAQLVMKEGKFDEAIGHLRIAEELSKDQHTLGRINSLRDDIRKTQTAVN
ncbi:MAG: CDC27 family protein, partial [Phycisphaerales bacterium]|nr:CDC27 family protein [Phycisphaerales bacterium]